MFKRWTVINPMDSAIQLLNTEGWRPLIYLPVRQFLSAAKILLEDQMHPDPKGILAKSILDLHHVHGISLENQPTTGFPSKWRLRNEHRNSILMTRNYQVLLIDWFKQISVAERPIRSATQIWVVTRHIWNFIRHLRRETSGLWHRQISAAFLRLPWDWLRSQTGQYQKLRT